MEKFGKEYYQRIIRSDTHNQRWTQFELDLIHCIKDKYPIIYTKAEDMTRHQRAGKVRTAWKQISDKFNDIPMTYIKARWASILDNYLKVKIYSDSTTGFNETIVKNKFMDGTLSFLEGEVDLFFDHHKAKKKTSKDNRDEGETDDENEINYEVDIKESLHEEVDLDDDPDTVQVKREYEDLDNEVASSPADGTNNNWTEEELMNATRLTKEMIDQLILIKTRHYYMTPVPENEPDQTCTPSMSDTCLPALPLETPLEHPKHIKRRRTLSSEPDEPGTTSMSDLKPPAEPNFLSDVISMQTPYLVSAVPSSPALHINYTSSPVPVAAGRPGGSRVGLNNQEILLHMTELENYGSEPDDDTDDDDDSGPVSVKRRNGTITDTPLDEPEHCTKTQNADDTKNETDTSSYLPRDMFDFQWDSFPESPIQPELRRETFLNNNVGPTSIFNDSYEAFTSIWNREIMEHIAKETNRYAHQTSRTLFDQNKMEPSSPFYDWRDTTVQELYVFFALILAMGVVVKSKLNEYWHTSNDVLATPGFTPYMTLRRFQLLSQCLHFNNNENFNPAQMDRGQAKLYKIQPVITHLNNRFQSLYVLSQNISLDDSLLQWQGWLANKKARIGVKSYEVSEPTTGYLWRFEIHSHEKQPPALGLDAVDPISATIPSTVLRLVQGLENKGYTLWMDDYYNSPALARKLKTLGFDCVGTLRTNRKFVPEALITLTKSQMLEGQITGFTSGDVDLIVWRDRNLVATISTYHGNAVSKVNGTLKPILVSDYNVIIGGVDKKDQSLSLYPIEWKRTNVWYKKLFRRLLNISVLNAYILMKQSNPNITHRNFRMWLVSALLKNNFVKAPVRPLPPSVFEAKKHNLSEYSRSKTQRIRRLCVVCRKRISSYCVGCDKAVCMGPCFVTLHQ